MLADSTIKSPLGLVIVDAIEEHFGAPARCHRNHNLLPISILIKRIAYADQVGARRSGGIQCGTETTFSVDKGQTLHGQRFSRAAIKPA